MFTKKVGRGRGFEEVPLRPVGPAPGVCTAGPFARFFHNLEWGKLAGLVHSKALSAEQHCSHVVEAVRLVQLKPAKVRYRPMRARLCFQPAKDLGRVDLLYEQRADRALEGVVVRVGVRPGEAMAVQVLGGEESFKSLLLVGSPSRRWSILRLGWFRLRPWLAPGFGGQIALRLVAGFKVKGWRLSSRQHGPRPVGQEVVDLFDQLVKLSNISSVLFPRDIDGRVLARAVGEVVKLHPPVFRLAIALGIFLRGPVRGMPRDEEAVPFLPNVLPNVGVSFSKGSATRLENGRAAVGSDLHLTRGVAEEERKGHGLSLHHAASWR